MSWWQILGYASEALADDAYYKGEINDAQIRVAKDEALSMQSETPRRTNQPVARPAGGGDPRYRDDRPPEEVRTNPNMENDIEDNAGAEDNNQSGSGVVDDGGDDTSGSYDVWDADGNLVGSFNLETYWQKIGEGLFGYKRTPRTGSDPEIQPPSPGSGDPLPSAPTFNVASGDPVEKFDIREYAELNYSWMNEELMNNFLEIYNSNGGEADDAIRELRTTQAYKDEFPGIFRDDGKTLRLEGQTPELDYITNVEAYKNYLADYNLNPDFFENKIVQLFENDVAPRELQERLDTAYTLLFPQFDAVKRYYVENYPNVAQTTDDISNEAIFASFLDEDISRDIIERRITVSQIGGAFGEQDVDITLSQAQRLISAGVSSTLAQQLAARAETQIPRLQRLARKYRGNENIFGTSEFLEAEVFADSEAQRLQEQLEAEEESLFSATGGSAIGETGVIGLEEI
tara:strand:+ start:2559 stop:3935 length:1377 start_codon:yes stop_codon:yes gene_type:complete